MKKQSGFTLVEIAIVMVIIGLLIGGVLKGQALIDNAKVKSVVSDLKGIQAGYYTYLDRKRAAPAVDTDYTATSLGGFWGSTRTEGILTGDANSTVPGSNALGGFIGVVNGATTIGVSGVAACTSLPSKFAQLVDTSIDDGISTSGSMRGVSLAVTGAGTLNENLVGASAITSFYGTAGYVIVCMEL
ncbi:MAG: prepilin-type N-terminal cleavage/methylation domain-containing protein [Sulfuricella sp.]